MSGVKAMLWEGNSMRHVHLSEARLQSWTCGSFRIRRAFVSISLRRQMGGRQLGGQQLGGRQIGAPWGRILRGGQLVHTADARVNP